MGVPRVVIVGRPNVGKSSIFNWLVGRRIAIVDPTAGVTRDRVTHLVQLDDRFVELVDTGGIGAEDADRLTEQIEQQIALAVQTASVILFVVDTRCGPVALDEEVARRLRYVKVPVLCVANKSDAESLDPLAGEFYRFGRKVIPVSAQQNRNRRQLIEEIYQRLPAPEAEEAEREPEMKVAIVGRRNVGKSTFINTLVNEPRMIVSEVPGTTRDSVDVRFELDGKAFLAIDTPGFLRKKSIGSDIEFYSLTRAQQSIRRADVVLLFFDASQRIAKPDKQLCEYVTGQCKPCIFVVNKWDLLAGSVPTERWGRYLRDTFRSEDYVPIAFVTGKTGKNAKTLLNHAQMLFRQSRTRVTTGQINRVVRKALEYSPPPLCRNRRPKLYYATQVAVQPPTIVVFCNNPDALAEPYRRYLLSVLRENLPFAEVPIKLYFRKRERHDRTDEIDARLQHPQPPQSR